MAERQRYVAFRVDAEAAVTMDGLVETLRELNDWAWVVAFDGSEGILRCPHTRKDDAIELLRGLEAIGGVAADVETLGTSGTIAKCRRKFLD